MPIYDQEFEQAGRYAVTLDGVHWATRKTKEHDSILLLVIPGYTERTAEQGNAMKFGMTKTLPFTSQFPASGKNAGRPWYEINAELCIRLGMDAPFDPSKVEEQLNGKPAEFVVDLDDYFDPPRLTVAWINPPSSVETITPAKAADMLNAMGLGSKPAPTTASNTPEAELDDIPF